MAVPPPARRQFLSATIGLSGGFALAGITQLLNSSTAQAQLQDSQDTPQTIANIAATAEALALSGYYHTLLGNPLGFDQQQLQALRLALAAEQQHLEVLQSLGGEPLTSDFYFPEGCFAERSITITTLLAIETSLSGAYLAAVRRLAELGEPRLAATTAQHAASESEHLFLLRWLGDVRPYNPTSLPAPIYYNVADAVPVLVPFIQGGGGLNGPFGTPNPSQISTLLGSSTIVKIPPFTKVF